MENTRLLSRLELSVDGRTLTPFAVAPTDACSDLAYIEVPELGGVRRQQVYVEMARTVENEILRAVLRVQNYSAAGTATLRLGVQLDADFADIEEAERGEREQSADVGRDWDPASRTLRFRYLHPKLSHAVSVRVEQAPGAPRWVDDSLVFEMKLEPHQPLQVVLLAEPALDDLSPDRRAAKLRDRIGSVRAVRQKLHDEAPRLVSTNDTVVRAWRAAIDDLSSLPLGLADGPATPVAGLPIYQQLFGRDSLTIAAQAAMAMPTMLGDTLAINAAWQGQEVDNWLDEEPGKMLHQARRGPLSLLSRDPFVRYYGDYTASTDFLMGLGLYLLWTGDKASVRRLLPAARAVAQWMETYGDADGDGFQEYDTRSPKGIKNQGWKDSADAVVDESGRVVENPIADSVVQAYWSTGLRLLALSVLVAERSVREAGRLWRSARQLNDRFEQAFWMPAERRYAMALGPHKEQVGSASSNDVHLLAAGILPKDKGAVVARRLFEPDLFSGWGVRTLSSQHVSYNPFSYHRGSVWPVESGALALGLAQYGCVEELHTLAEAVFASTDLFEGNRLPETLGGIPRDEEHIHPGVYPNANEPQGWSASAIVMVVQALLGLRPVAPLGLLVMDPHLPAWLPDLRLEGLRVGRGEIDLEVRRTRGGRTAYRVTKRSGRLRVVRQPPPLSPDASLPQRLGALMPWPFRGARA